MNYKAFLTSVFIVIIIPAISLGQGSILPTSGFVSNGNISLVFSAGETVVGKFENETMKLVSNPVSDLPVIPTSIEGIDDLPKKFGLSQNYPNPFNPSTTISYALPKASVVSIDVFNILGRKVGSLVNQRKAAGNHTVLFQAGNLSSGVYFYTLRIEGKILKSQRMLLIK